MTNREYLEANVGAILGSQGIEALALSAQGAGACLNLDERADASACSLALYHGVPLLIGKTLANVTEGGYSISWNESALRLFYSALCARLGKPNLLDEAEKPRVRNRSHLW